MTGNQQCLQRRAESPMDSIAHGQRPGYVINKRLRPTGATIKNDEKLKLPIQGE